MANRTYRQDERSMSNSQVTENWGVRHDRIIFGNAIQTASIIVCANLCGGRSTPMTVSAETDSYSKLFDEHRIEKSLARLYGMIARRIRDEKAHNPCHEHSANGAPQGESL